jgi:hypothetical protein
VLIQCGCGLCTVRHSRKALRIDFGPTPGTIRA